MLEILAKFSQVLKDGFRVHVDRGFDSCQVSEAGQHRGQNPQILSDLLGGRCRTISTPHPDGLPRELPELSLLVRLPVEVAGHLPLIPVPPQSVYMELTLGAQGFLGLLESLGKGDDGWLNHSSNVAVVVPPDAAMMPVTIRLELAERCEVV
jgi:hypothetical protein